MTAATFSTTCARCAAPLEVTDATADDAVKAHEESCIIPGDDVRWDYNGEWIEGRLDSIIEKSYGQIVYIDVVRTSFYGSIRHRSVGLGGAATLRRIPRPERSKLNERDGCLYYGDIKLTTGPAVAHRDLKPKNAPRLSAEGRATYDRLRAEYSLPPPDPLDVEHDGVTLRVLLARDANNRCEALGQAGLGGKPTPSQRAAVSAHWSAELRAKVAASSERERLTVVVEQDAEDEPW